MHDTNLLLTLAVSFVGALVLGYGTHRMGLSPIVGYLLAGVLVGPHTPGFTADRELAEQLAEVGVVLLMFGVGLQFHLSELLGVRRIAVPGALTQIGVSTALGALVGMAFGWSLPGGMVYGVAISVASTVVLLRVLSDNNDLHTRSGHIAVGWLVVEDLFTVLVLVLLPVLFGAGERSAGGIFMAVGVSSVKLAALLVFAFVAGGRAIPWILDRVAYTRSRELFTLTVLVLALGIAVGSAEFFGASMALGAFLAGMVVGRSEFSLRAATEALPMRDAFAVLFFVSVGMLVNPAALWETPGLVAATLGIVLLGKPLAALAIVLLLRYPLRVALAVAVALAQIGEFTFILAALGSHLGLLAEEAENALIAAAIVSISLNPLLYRFVSHAHRWVQRTPHLRRRLAFLSMPVRAENEGFEHSLPTNGSPANSAIVVGYGPVGRTLVELLREHGVEPTIIEMNLDTVREMREHGLRAVYGDAMHAETLNEAGVSQAGALMLSAAYAPGVEDVIRLAREVNPQIRVFARATFVREIDSLREAGADAVFTAESEVAFSLVESVLRHYGAGADRLDRARHRLRAELFDKVPTV
jgi:CPA2 family monovalent cation:H+ antiporter-2